MFSDNYIKLCAQKGKAVSAVAEELGYSRSAGTGWASGSIPRRTTLKQIADYFGVTAEELLADKKESPAAISDDRVAEQVSKFSPEFWAALSAFLEAAKRNPKSAQQLLVLAVGVLEAASPNS